MILIVDASVAVKWFVREELHEQALALLEKADLFEAPDLIVAEVTNIAWKKCARGEMTQPKAQAMAAAIGNYIPRLRPSGELAGRALDMALELDHPVYDCLYLACSEAASGVLVTADKKFCQAVRGTPFEPLVRYLGDFGLTS